MSLFLGGSGEMGSEVGIEKYQVGVRTQGKREENERKGKNS